MRTLTILIAVNFLAACSGDADRTPEASAGSTPIERYANTTSPDGEVEASVYHYDSPSGGHTQVSLDFVGLGCGSGSAAWSAYDIGMHTRLRLLIRRISRFGTIRQEIIWAVSAALSV